MALEKTIDVLGIGNAIIDVLADADDAFLLQHNLNKGSMTLVDEEASSNIYSSYICSLSRVYIKTNIYFI